MKDDWVPQGTTNPVDQRHAATLAHQILVTLNTYPDATRLVAGKKKDDEEFWADTTRGWQPGAPVNWRHANHDNLIVRCARVPYIVRSRRGGGFPSRLFLDHILVGFTQPGGSAPAHASWVMDAGPPPLNRLGALLVEDLWPGPMNTCRCVDGWMQESAGPDHGYTKVGSPPDRDWKFREMSIRPDETVRITLTSDTNERRYLLVGYEGGGGW